MAKKFPLLKTEKCITCGEPFQTKWRKWYHSFVMKVCSGDCFEEAVASARDFGKRIKIEKDIEPLMKSGSVKVFGENKTMRSGYEIQFINRIRSLKKENRSLFGEILYEPFIFYLKDKSGYLPDFYIRGIFFEVKGVWQPKAKKKFLAFAKEYKFPIFVVDREFLSTLKGKKW